MLQSIFISVPPSTVEADLLGCYGSLLTSMGIHNYLGTTDGKFSHPVESVRTQILTEFQQNFGLLEGLTANYPSIELVSVKSNSRTVQLVLEVN